MKIKPMLGEYEIPMIERIGTVERRHLVEVSVPGLAGSYHQDLGSAPVAIRIEGTLAGDDSRDDFLTAVRDKFKAGDPVDFVADITTATEVEQVLIADLKVLEVAGSSDTFRYAITLTQHVEPPAPAAPLEALQQALDLEAGDLFDALQLPDLLASLPDLKDPTPPLRGTLDGVRTALQGLAGVSGALTELFGAG